MNDKLKKLVPKRMRRLYRKYISSIVKDRHYYEMEERKSFFHRAFMSLAFNEVKGDYVEFGCCGCNTFSMAFRYSRLLTYFPKLWAFDSFCGLPERSLPADEHPIWVQGTMSIDLDQFKAICCENNIPPSQYHIIEGFYEHSLSGSQTRPLPSDICLAYIDCDLYSSTKTVLEFLMPRLKHGMIIAFDDYYCWSASQVSGERKACTEFFKDHPDWILVPFMPYGGGGGGMSFIVESRSLGGSCGICY